ncbi:hypothetical protein [Paraflavitalea speifideaquila]|nr:hypothetical protein [Paraflavitalea speifideiaquila]
MDTNLIGSKIARARKQVSISQAQLAQRLFATYVVEKGKPLIVLAPGK